MADSVEKCARTPADAVGCRHRQRWGTLLVLLALAGWFAHFAYLRITLRPTPRPEYWAEQIAARDPPPPGAVSSQQAREILQNQPWLSDRDVRTTLQSGPGQILVGPWDESRKDIAAVTALFETEEFQRARTELREVIEAGWQDDLDFSAGSPVYMLQGYCLGWSAWLTAHARWSTEHRGDVETAVEDWVTILRMWRQHAQGSFAGHSRLPQSYTWLATQIIHAVQEGTAPADVHAFASEFHAALGPEPSPAALHTARRAGLMSTLERIYVREGGDWLDVSEAASLSLWFRPGTPVGKPSRLWNLFSPLFHDLAQAGARVEEALVLLDSADTITAASQAYPVLGAIGPGRLGGYPKDPWSCSTPQEMAWTALQYYRGRCTLDAALTLLALRAYHEQHGFYPKTLDELIPAFLPRLPIDYADRRPLRYCRTSEGFVLYSIGSDGVDNGGSCADGQKPWEEFNTDAVFSTMHRPEKQP